MIPLAISYERLFEIRNIANENMSGKVEDVGLRKVREMIKSGPDQKLGKIHIRFGEPINLKNYIK